MPTDTERREVARRLRAIEPDNFSSYSEEHEFVEKALGIWDDYDKLLWHVVADLIEPSCDRDALLKLVYLLQAMGEKSDEKGRYDLGITFTSIADRIREALGVES